MNSTDNDKLKENRIEVKVLKPGHRFSMNVYDSENNLILEAHTPVSQAVLNHLSASGITFLYFDASKISSNTDNEPVNKPILSENLRSDAYAHTKNLLDEIRYSFINSPGDSIGKAAINKSRALVDEIITDIDKKSDGVFDMMLKLKDMDDYYYHHSMNVAILASILGSRLDFKSEISSAMGVGGFIHDIGFSSVSKDILHKAQLNDSDFDIIKSHTHIGYKFVEKNPHLHDIEKRIILLHHERADGDGYPYGFDLDQYQNNIPKEVRMLGLVDIFVRLTLPKPGNTGMTPTGAMRYMVNMIYTPYKTKYAFIASDLREFIRALGFIINRGQPFMLPGDLVRISTGDIGIVEEMNRLYPLNPKMKIIKNSRGETMKRPVSLDLIKTYKEYVSNIYDRNPSGKYSLNSQNEVSKT